MGIPVPKTHVRPFGLVVLAAPGGAAHVHPVRRAIAGAAPQQVQGQIGTSTQGAMRKRVLHASRQILRLRAAGDQPM